MNTKTKIQAVVKRDGRSAAFDTEKIAFAIFKALRATGKPSRENANTYCSQVTQQLEQLHEETPTVENIQDIVERVLLDNQEFDAAKAYIIYRYQHQNIREAKNIFSNIDLIEDYINLQDWRVKESANSTYSLQGLNQHISTIISSQYWLSQIYPEEIAQAHKSGRFHIHDLGFLSVYCVGWDLEDLLLSGFRGVEGKTQSKPPKHLRTALGQIVNFFYTMQGEAAGAQALSSFDTYLAPFIRHDKLDYTGVKQCLQEFMFNVNVPTRVGFQTPFTNVTLDLEIPGHMLQQPVIIGGELQTSVYGEYQEEMKVFNQAFAEVMLEGDANGSVFSFPIPTYNITKEFDWDNPAYEKIWEMTAKYGIPYFSNFVNSDMSPDDVRSMCCRLRLDKRKLKSRGGGLFGANPLTGSVGVVTINLPRLGYESASEEDFFQRLSHLMELGKSSLEIKRKVIEQLTHQGLYPYSKFYLRHLYQKNGSYWDNHFSTIGLVGMNECCMNFLGKEMISEKGHAFAVKIMDFMRERLQDFQAETGHIYNLEATPAEGTSYRLARIDKMQYADIIVANEQHVVQGAEPYYTNSTQLPVAYTDDLFEALRLQDDFQVRYTGGTVFHTFVGERQLSTDAIKRLLIKVMNNFKLPYITLSPTFSICPSHGYLYGEHHQCPKCQANNVEQACTVFSRIVGYLRPVDQWNDGKRQEFDERKLFDHQSQGQEKPLELIQLPEEVPVS
ncbi:ribonucleoside triphosphate reductase [Sunxiuqinia elliptica]|uniref:Ribonucleoside-triphosphate reductase class III catalytic subunit n=1 Tax=Sunxiuqinia elliptica TaxID=655355 RepID=A0A4R6GYF2_9BACT|nr:ribonucleoside triphosphate reductase [Sunxiuqinia elliptica]TDN99885.1 ribonucleoside-triphosphate reductase class III catalytic subunit [Sunxiuqinia elliptica]TDO57077.1 ribonucleoside-triphosphate reductase class III catalytic subunit [Sunxiuqinia elliptica]